MFYLEGQPEDENTRNIVTNVLSSMMSRPVPLEYARRVGNRPVNNGPPRKILIKLKSYSDKEEILRLANHSGYQISNFVENENEIEKIHHDFCKKSLNISKYASNTAVQGELGRMPIVSIARGLAIKYWLRLNSGTENRLLNESYKICVQNNHDWIQSIQSMLCENGFGDVWTNPALVDKESFHKYFRRRLNDQHVQNWSSKIQNSNRFTTLQKLENNYEMKQYVTKVKDPNVREIFTRLRIDMNLLNTSKSNREQQNDICSFCNVESETVGHFLLRCSKYQNIRTQTFNTLTSHEPDFEHLNENDKLSYILDLRCSDINIGVCCNFVSKIYTQRGTDNMR